MNDSGAPSGQCWCLAPKFDHPRVPRPGSIDTSANEADVLARRARAMPAPSADDWIDLINRDRRHDRNLVHTAREWNAAPHALVQVDPQASESQNRSIRLPDHRQPIIPPTHHTYTLTILPSILHYHSARVSSIQLATSPPLHLLPLGRREGSHRLRRDPTHTALQAACP